MSMPALGRPKEIEGIDLVDAYGFLDALRESGVTNMFGARPYLQEEFGITEGAARTILVAWMKDFSQEEAT